MYTQDQIFDIIVNATKEVVFETRRARLQKRRFAEDLGRQLH